MVERLGERNIMRQFKLNYICNQAAVNCPDSCEHRFPHTPFKDQEWCHKADCECERKKGEEQYCTLVRCYPTTGNRKRR